MTVTELSVEQCERLWAAHGLSAHQARLAFQAMHRHGLLDPENMPGLSGKCRNFLRSLPPLPRLLLDTVQRAQDGAVKLRLKTRDGQMLEAVIIPVWGDSPNRPVSVRGDPEDRPTSCRRVTLCVSCQAGCAVGCAFCHTGALGFKRNLEAWEIIEQYRIAQSAIPNPQSPITNVVFMGMGEPLHNLDNVVQACRVLNENLGAGLSPRHIVVSTAGVGNRMRELWQSGVAALALSLHATTDELRGQLMPLARQWDLAALRDILRGIPWRRRESVTIAYLLLDGLNDTRDDARRLAEWLKGLPAKLNLLEFNPYPGCCCRRASPEKLAAFRQWLKDLGVFNTLRHSRGSDVLAACGQLAGRGAH